MIVRDEQANLLALCGLRPPSAPNNSGWGAHFLPSDKWSASRRQKSRMNGMVAYPFSKVRQDLLVLATHSKLANLVPQRPLSPAML
jgi:hypothetical protein